MLLNHDTGLIDTIQTLDVSATPPGGGVAGQLTITGIAGLVVPSGTTAQRPATPVNGTTRYNQTLTAFEFFQNNAWVTFAGSITIGTTTIALGASSTTLAGLTSVTSTSFIGALTGNATTATTLQTARTIATTGDATYSVSFDGSANVSAAITLATVNAGPVSNLFQKVTTNGKGLVTATSAVTSADITTSLGYTPVNKAGDTLTGALNMGGFAIGNVGAPVSGSDAATKNYVDAATTGLSWKQAVRAGTTAAGTLGTSFANGSSIDGVTLVTGDRILIKNQATASENGIYTVNATGAPTRATDMDVSAEFPNATVYISQGTTLADTGWTQVNDNITVGTTAVSFIQFSGTGSYTAGTGLTLTGNTFSITAPIATTLGGTGLTTIGTANQLLGSNAGATGLEYKTITAGTAVSVVNTVGAITINNTGVTSAVAGTGISVSSATGAVTITNTGVTSVAATTASAGLTISGSPITTTGTITFTLGTDLQTLSSFNAATGMAARTAAGTWALRTNTGTTNQIVVTNGDGVAGNPTYAIASNVVLPGTGAMTVVTGTAAQQPTAAIGQLRFNSTSGRLEWSNATTWSNVGLGDGSVTSVALALPSIFTVSGSPVTTSGTLTATLASQTANTVFAAPNGSAGAPTFRSLAYADLPIVLYKENPSTPTAATTTGANAQSFGSGGAATLTGEKSFANGNFATAGDAQNAKYILRNTTSNATPTNLFLDGSAALMVMPNNSVWTFDMMVAGRRTDAVGGGAGYRIFGVIRKDTTSGSVTFVGTPTKQVLGETTASLDCSAVADTTNGSLNVSVSGLAAQTWRWVATVTTTEVTN